jgi:hypothetical protein
MSQPKSFTIPVINVRATACRNRTLIWLSPVGPLPIHRNHSVITAAAEQQDD